MHRICTSDAESESPTLGAIRSTDPRTGDAIEIQFVEGGPKGDAALFILGGYDGTNVREDWCPLVNFFTSQHEAETWVAANELNGDIVSVVQVAEEAAAMWRSPKERLSSPSELSSFLPSGFSAPSERHIWTVAACSRMVW